MSNYLITYDLNKTGQRYEELYEAIKGYEYYKDMESVWFVKTSYSAEQIFEDLKKYIDENDRLFISEINDNRQGWLSQECWNFLES